VRGRGVAHDLKGARGFLDLLGEIDLLFQIGRADLGAVLFGEQKANVVGQPIDEPAPGPTTSAAPAAPVRLVMFGDSVAHSLAGGTVLDFPNVAPWTPEQATAPGLVSVARPGCSFLPGLVTLEGGSGSDLSSFCGDWRADLAASLDAADATHVALLLVNDMSDRLVDGDFVEFGSTEHQSLLQGFLDELRAIVSDRGAELVLLGPAPRDAEFVPVEGDRSELMLELLERYGAANAVKVVALAAAPATARFDGVHYSWEPARQVIAWLIEQVRR